MLNDSYYKSKVIGRLNVQIDTKNPKGENILLNMGGVEVSHGYSTHIAFSLGEVVIIRPKQFFRLRGKSMGIFKIKAETEISAVIDFIRGNKTRLRLKNIKLKNV